MKQFRLILPLFVGFVILFTWYFDYEPISFLKFSEIPPFLGVVALLLGGIQIKAHYKNKS